MEIKTINIKKSIFFSYSTKGINCSLKPSPISKAFHNKFGILNNTLPGMTRRESKTIYLLLPVIKVSIKHTATNTQAN